MTRSYRFSIDHGINGEPPPGRPIQNAPGAAAKAEKMQHSLSRIGAVLCVGPSYLWNGTHQQLIPVLPEDHPNYRQNREMITETIRRWDRGTTK
jgi:hypothetical protein